jgi:hypothetical protein
MDKRRSVNIKQINRLLVIACMVVSAVVAAFVSFVIASTNKMATYVNEVYDNSYAVALNVLNARNHFQDAHTLMFRAVDGHENFEKDEVISLLDNNYIEVVRALDEIKGRYGSGSTEKLDGYIEDVDRLFREVVEEVYDGDGDFAADMMETEEIPLYHAIDEELSKIINMSTVDMEQLIERAAEANLNTKEGAIILGAARRYRGGTRDIYHREVLFNIITSNVDDVFVIYDMDSGNVEYVSSNVVR